MLNPHDHGCWGPASTYLLLGMGTLVRSEKLLRTLRRLASTWDGVAVSRGVYLEGQLGLSPFPNCGGVGGLTWANGVTMRSSACLR